MTPKAGRYVAGAATGLAIALSLTACKGASQDKASGGEPTSGAAHLTAAQNVLAKVSERTSGVTSYRGTMSMAMSASGQQVDFKGNMACRLKPSKAMKLIMTMRGIGQSTARVTEIVTGDKLYMKMPELQARTGKPWVGIKRSDLHKESGADLQSMQQSDQGDPALNTKLLTASKDVRQVGQETVGGVRTTHYKGTYSMTDALAKLSGDQRAQAQKSFAEAGFDKINFDMWVDGRQLPRRVTIATPSDAKVGMKMTLNYTAFNVPVSVTVPPKSQVADGAGLLGGGQNVPG
jgi:hypothetical protein